jgi:RNA polymerase sigma-70 factor, ECF subfamily
MPSPPTEFTPERYRGYLLVLARRQWDDALRGLCDPSDIVHDAIAEAIRALPKFRGESPAVFRAWLCRILSNTLKDRVKAEKQKKRDRRRAQSLDAGLDESAIRFEASLAADDTSPSNRAQREEDLLRLADALVQLEGAQFEAVSLHHLQGLTLSEIAARLGKSNASVAGLLRRGLDRLSELMGGRRN